MKLKSWNTRLVWEGVGGKTSTLVRGLVGCKGLVGFSGRDFLHFAGCFYKLEICWYYLGFFEGVEVSAKGLKLSKGGLPKIS